MLYGLANRLAGYDESRAEDILQQAWLRGLERLAGFRWDSQLRTWLCGIVVNCAHESRRRERHGGVLSADAASGNRVSGDPASRHPTPAHATSADDAVRRIGLERALARLPDGYRHAIILHDVEGYTHDEIGRLLGISAGTSKSQLSRARGAMRSLLEAPPGANRAPGARPLTGDDR